MNEQLENTHNEAMELADRADDFRRDKDAGSARRLYRQAMEKEREAAIGYAALSNTQPATVAMLFRSAATLARDAGEIREAERLISLGLSATEIPPSIAEELRDLWEEVQFRRHLELRNVELTDQEVQMSLTGEAVSFGMVQSEVFLDRSEALQDLFYRAAERRSGLPYRKQGLVSPVVRDQFAVYLSAFRGGSFAVTYRIGVQKEAQPSLLHGTTGEEDALDASAILDEVLNGLRLFDENQEQELETLFEGAYLKNFLEQARRLAPDGKRITQVGLTIQHEPGKSKPLALRRVVERQTRKAAPKILEYTGRIIEIKERPDKNAVLVTLETENKVRISAFELDAEKASQSFQKTMRIRVEKRNGGLFIREMNPT